jgi:hypothetical protein
MQTTTVFLSSPVIPVENPFKFRDVPNDFLLGCTSDSCFSVSCFEKIAEEFRAISPQDSDVIITNTILFAILFVSPAIAKIISENPDLAPSRI